MLALTIKESFWDRGDYPQVVNNGSDYIVLSDPWVNGTIAAPFDKRTYFFLVALSRWKLTRHRDSLLFDSQCRCWWNERLVP
jgi:hypothetical protein